MSEAGDRAASGWRIPAVVRDVVLIVLGAVLAVGAEDWRDPRNERTHTEQAVAGIRAELSVNRERVQKARGHHLEMADTLGGYLARHALPPERVYFGGVFNPATLVSTAWETARQTGAINGIPYPTMLAIAPVYENQSAYRDLAAQLGSATMADLVRLGPLPVFRDRFANFILLEHDFANRERTLERQYGRAIAQLDSIHAPGTRVAEAR